MEYSLWFSGLSACGALAACFLTLLGMLTPWWTMSEPDELAPIITEVSLWTTNTRWTLRMDGGVETHTGCDYRCNKARFTKPRVYSKCQSWEDIKEWAPELCSAGLGSRAESLVTTTTAEPILYGSDGLPLGDRGQPLEEPYNFDKETNVDVFQNPDIPYTLKPPVAPNTIPISTYRPYQFGAATTTVTAFFTYTITRVTSTVPPGGATAQVTPIPVATTPMLGAAFCAQPTWEERTTAPYTEWELNFELPLEIMDRIFAQLNPFFAQVPKWLFTQRPLRNEQVRLVWEAYVQRSPQMKWLGRWPCPSVPARQLHSWIYSGTVDPFLVQLGEEALMPPNTKPAEWSDWALKEAWEIELLDLTTTTLATLRTLQPRTTPAAEPNTAPPTAAPMLPPEPEAYPPDVTSFVSCHLAVFDMQKSAEGPFAWFETEDPCLVSGNFEKIWIAKGCMFLAVIISMAHSFPAMVLFLGAKQRFAWRFPQQTGMFMATGCAFFQSVAVITAATSVVKPGLNGIGFWSTICGILASITSATFCKLSKATLNMEEPPAPTSATVAMGTRGIDAWSQQTAAQVDWANKESKKSTRRVYPETEGMTSASNWTYPQPVVS